MSPVGMDMVVAEERILTNNKVPETLGIMDEVVVVVEEDLIRRIFPIRGSSKITDR